MKSGLVSPCNNFLLIGCRWHTEGAPMHAAPEKRLISFAVNMLVTVTNI